jgi:hypothetical protein
MLEQCMSKLKTDKLKDWHGAYKPFNNKCDVTFLAVTLLKKG